MSDDELQSLLLPVGKSLGWFSCPPQDLLLSLAKEIRFQEQERKREIRQSPDSLVRTKGQCSIKNQDKEHTNPEKLVQKTASPLVNTDESPLPGFLSQNLCHQENSTVQSSPQLFPTESQPSLGTGRSQRWRRVRVISDSESSDDDNQTHNPTQTCGSHGSHIRPSAAGSTTSTLHQQLVRIVDSDSSDKNDAGATTASPVRINSDHHCTSHVEEGCSVSCTQRTVKDLLENDTISSLSTDGRGVSLVTGDCLPPVNEVSTPAVESCSFGCSPGKCKDKDKHTCELPSANLPSGELSVCDDLTPAMQEDVCRQLSFGPEKELTEVCSSVGMERPNPDNPSDRTRSSSPCGSDDYQVHCGEGSLVDDHLSVVDSLISGEDGMFEADMPSERTALSKSAISSSSKSSRQTGEVNDKAPVSSRGSPRLVETQTEVSPLPGSALSQSSPCEPVCGGYADSLCQKLEFSSHSLGSPAEMSILNISTKGKSPDQSASSSPSPNLTASPGHLLQTLEGTSNQEYMVPDRVGNKSEINSATLSEDSFHEPSCEPSYNEVASLSTPELSANENSVPNVQSDFSALHLNAEEDGKSNNCCPSDKEVERQSIGEFGKKTVDGLVDENLECGKDIPSWQEDAEAEEGELIAKDTGMHTDGDRGVLGREEEYGDIHRCGDDEELDEMHAVLLDEQFKALSLVERKGVSPPLSLTAGPDTSARQPVGSSRHFKEIVISSDSDDDDFESFLLEAKTPKQRVRPAATRQELLAFIVDDDAPLSDEEEALENTGLCQPSSNTDHRFQTPGSRRPLAELAESTSQNDPFEGDVEDDQLPWWVTESGQIQKVGSTPAMTPLKTPSHFHSSTPMSTPAFKRSRDGLARSLFAVFNSTVFSNKLPGNMDIKWNKNMRTTAGYCYTKVIQDEFVAHIELADKVCDSQDRLRDTLLHEMCHAAAWVIDHVRGGHGATFWKWAHKASLAHPDIPAVDRCHSYDIATKYKYVCKGCGYIVGRHSKSLDVTKKCCPYCSSAFCLEESRPVQPMTPFAKYVKDNFARVKASNPGSRHGDVMRELSAQYSAQKPSNPSKP